MLAVQLNVILSDEQSTAAASHCLYLVFWAAIHGLHTLNEAEYVACAFLLHTCLHRNALFEL